jgi:hypothetical protein
VIITGRGPGRCVAAVLFSHEDFPRARFGHRFPLEPFAEGHEKTWLMISTVSQAQSATAKPEVTVPLFARA